MAKIVKVNITVSEKLLDSKGGLRKEFLRIGRGATSLSLERIRGELAKEAPSGAMGILGNSFIQKITEKGGKILGEIKSIFYGRFIQEGFGGKGKVPPVDPVKLWVKRKGIHRKLVGKPWMKNLLASIQGERFKPQPRMNKGNFTLNEKLDLATFFVLRKIARKGVKPNPFITRAVKKSTLDVERIYINSFKKI